MAKTSKNQEEKINPIANDTVKPVKNKPTTKSVPTVKAPTEKQIQAKAKAEKKAKAKLEPVVQPSSGTIPIITKKAPEITDPRHKEELSSPVTIGHTNKLIEGQGNFAHVIENILSLHRENTKGDVKAESLRQENWGVLQHLQKKYPQIPSLSTLQEGDVRVNESQVPIHIMRKLKEKYADLPDKSSNEAQELDHQINSIWTGLHHWSANQGARDKSFDLGKTPLGNAYIATKDGKSTQTYKNPSTPVKDEDGEAPKESTASEYAKKFIPRLSQASAPKYIQAAKDLKSHARKLSRDYLDLKAQFTAIKNKNTPQALQIKAARDNAFALYHDAKNDYDNMEHQGLRMNLRHLLSYSKNFAANINFLQWYRKDVTTSDINVAHLFNNHPMTQGMRGLFGRVTEKKGKHSLTANATQVKNLLIFKILGGPTSINMRPDPNAHLSLKILEDGYYNLQKAKGDVPLDPSKVDLVDILRHAHIDQRNYYGTANYKKIDKPGYLDSEGNPLEPRDYPGGVDVYRRNKKTGELVGKQTKWQQMPGATEKFIKFLKARPKMTANKFVDHYYLGNHDVYAEGADKEIKKDTFMRAEFSKLKDDPEGYLLFKRAQNVPGLLGMGHKLGAYIASLSTLNLMKLAKLQGINTTMNIGDPIDRVQMELLSNIFNVIHSGVPENASQRAMYNHALMHTAAELGWFDDENPKDGDISSASSDMIQAASWEATQGGVRAFDGINPSGTFSQGVIRHGINAKAHSTRLAEHFKETDPKLSGELSRFSDTFQPILNEDVYESPEDKTKRNTRAEQFRGIGGQGTSLDDQALQKFLNYIPKNQAAPTSRFSKSAHTQGRFQHLIKLMRAGKPIKFAQFTPTPNGMTGTPAATRTNKPFANSIARSPGGKNLAQGALGNQINSKAGVETTAQNAIHDGPVGSEESIVHMAPIGTLAQKLKYLAAWHGISGQKKSMLVFTPNPNGPDAMYHIEHPNTDVGAVKEQFDLAGINYKTILPGAKSTKVMVFDPNREKRNIVSQFATLNNLNVEENSGQGEIVGHNGDWNSAGALPKSRQAYQNIIGEYENAQMGNQPQPQANNNAVPASNQGAGQAQQLSRKTTTKAKIKFDRSRRILEGFLRQHNTPNKELPPVGDLLSQDLQNIKPEHLSKYQQLVPDAKWEDIEGAVNSLSNDPSLYDDMTSESNRREMYCKEHARTVLQSSGLKKLIDSLQVQQLIPEHAQHLIDDAKDGDYFSLEAISSELKHGVPSLRAFAKAAEKEYNKAGKVWDKMRTPQPQKFAKKSAHAKDQYRAGKHGVNFRGAQYNGGQFAPQNDGVKRFEKDSNLTHMIKKLRGV